MRVEEAREGEGRRVTRMRVYLARVRIDSDGVRCDGDDGGPAPPGSNRRGVTARVERPRRGPESS